MKGMYIHKASFTLALEASDAVLEIIEQMPLFPDACPNCDYTHKSKMFVLVKDLYVCDSCGYVLQDSDMWHHFISE